MNCHEVQTHLSEYLDGALDSLRNKSLEGHLLACPVCRAEVDGLADCIRQVAQLPLLEPPPGFAQRVMAHTRALEDRPSLWQKVISPLRYPVPIQASAAVLVAILAVLLYRNEPPIKNNPPTPATEKALTPSSTPPPSEKSSADQQNANSDSPLRAAARKAKQDGGRAGTAEKASSPAPVASPSPKETTTQAAAKAEVASAIGELRDLPHRPPIHAQEVATGRENLRPDRDPFGFGPTLGVPFRGFFAPERALSPLSEPSADVEFVVRRRESEQKKNADARRAESESRAASAVAKRSSAPATPQANSLTEVRWFTVPAGRYDQFKKELAAEATIDSERPIGSMTNDLTANPSRELLIKVIVLTPLDR